MALSGFLFLSWRIFELLITIPIVGMLAWFVHQYVRANQLTPEYILILFIISTLALAWIVFTLIAYLRARHDALFVAVIDLGFVGAFIGAVVVMRFVAKQNCSNLNAGVTTSGSYFNYNVNKTCAMLKASFALAIIDILAFAVTFVSTTPFHLGISSCLLTSSAPVPRPPRTPQPPQRRRRRRQARVPLLRLPAPTPLRKP